MSRKRDFLLIDEAAIERLRIAARVLNLRYDQREEVTDAEIETLKSYLGGDDVTNVAVEEIAATVIRRELKLEPNNQPRN